MLGVGLIFGALFVGSGHYYVQGVGYATILDILCGTLRSASFLVVLFALKLAATCLTLGSGASGGVFSPSLFMGATLGGACGLVLHALFPGLPIQPMACALIGMVALVAGATGAALTAIVMIFEMTLDYAVVLPMTLAAAVSYGLRRFMLADSIYTMKLRRRGHMMPEALMANAHLVHHVGDLVMDRALVLPAETPIERAAGANDPQAPAHFIVVDGEQVTGVLPREWLLAHLDALRGAGTLGQVRGPQFVVVPRETTIFNLIAAMQRMHASIAVVVSGAAGAALPATIEGVVTKVHLAEAFAEGMELFED